MRDSTLACCNRGHGREGGTGEHGIGGLNMTTNEPVTLARDVEASVVPVGTKVTLLKGEQAHITQSLGGSYTVIVRGNMFRVEGKDADALGLEVMTPANVVGQASRL